MRRFTVLALVALLLSACVLPAIAQSKTRKSKGRKAPAKAAEQSKPEPPARSADWKVAPDLDARLARFQAVQIPFRTATLTEKEIQLVYKLVDASRYIESIYWRQSDPEGLNFLQELAGSTNSKDVTLYRLLQINGSRYDLVDNNRPFIGGDPMPPGRGLYPKGLTRAEIQKFIATHPSEKSAIYSPYSVIRRRGDDLESLPYHVAYRWFLEPAAKALNEAADIAEDPQFAQFLRKRADALLTDNYFESDSLWVALKDPKFDIIFGPDEVYLDDVLGVKTSYQAAVMIRDEAESQKLRLYQKYIPAIQEARPLAQADKPSKAGLQTPMEVMETPFRAGDLLHGYQAVADNLPNSAEIHEKFGSKKIFFKDFMDARLQYIVLPVAQRMMRPDQSALATKEGYLTTVVLHEMAHDLGPAFARKAPGRIEIPEALGPVYSAIEEAKADVTGMFALKWLVDHGVLPEERLREYYSSYVAGIFRTVRFGVAEAHGRAQMLQFNWLAERGVLYLDRGEEPVKESANHGGHSRYLIDYAKMPEAIAGLAQELLEIEATGDRERAEALMAKYDKMPATLRNLLQLTRDIPVDVYPVFAFPEYVQ